MSRPSSRPLSVLDFTAQELAELRQLIRSVHNRDAPEEDLPLAPTGGIESNLTRLARSLKSTRNQRDRYFDASLFGEPAWDILLTLYIAHAEGYRLTISEITESANAPSTTGLRWLAKLETLGLVCRMPNQRDRRAFYAELSESAATRMKALLEEVEAKYLAAGRNPQSGG